MKEILITIYCDCGAEIQVSTLAKGAPLMPTCPRCSYVYKVLPLTVSKNKAKVWKQHVMFDAKEREVNFERDQNRNNS